MWILFDQSMSSSPDARGFFASLKFRDNMMPNRLDGILRDVGEIEKDVPGPDQDSISQH